MKFTLRNLGRLQEATIDLSKDIIILAGPNNTSKTYVAHAIYGLGQHLWSEISVADVMKKSITMQPGESRLEIDLGRFIAEHLPELLAQVSANYKKYLPDVFATDDSFIIHTILDLELSNDRITSGQQALLDNEFSGSYPWAPASLSVSKKAANPNWIFEQRSTTLRKGAVGPQRSTPRDDSWSQDVRACIANILYGCFFYDAAQTYILTAERAAIQLFSRELSLNRTQLVDRLLQAKSSKEKKPQAGEALVDILDRRARRYPLAIQDSLLYANDLATHKKQSSPLAQLANRLEQELLGGAIRIDDDGEMMFQPGASGPSLSLHLSSSSVKSLSGLSFYLRHIADVGQFLIIDEPELNLHPDNQRRVARVLARLARSGVKVLMTTHSDYIIREINNLIMLSADTEGTLRESLGYSKEETLSPEQVGAYLFDASRANPMEVKPTGIEVETIDEEINALNSESQRIYFSLFNKDDA
jgi:hypothetical protein